MTYRLWRVCSSGQGKLGPVPSKPSCLSCLRKQGSLSKAFLKYPGPLQLRLLPTSRSSTEPEGLVGPSSPRPNPLLQESLENYSVEVAEGEQEPEGEALGGTNSEPGTPRAGRSAIRVGASSRAERCAGVHISDPYNVNLPLHITSILNVPPNIISNVALARLTRGLECPALQPRTSPAFGPGPGPGLGPGPPGEPQPLGFGWLPSTASLDSRLGESSNIIRLCEIHGKKISGSLQIDLMG